MEYKKLSNNQIIISLDRLTRFKPVEEKYLRVFKDIIISNLINPKFKKSELEIMPVSQIKDLAVEIFNNSFDTTNPTDYKINEALKKYENNVWSKTTESEILLNNKLDYCSAINLLKNSLPNNLRWLKELKNDEDIYKKRKEEAFLYPISMILLVEGITEEILLPVFADKLNFLFDKYGIKIVAAGGKNQVVKTYYSLYEKLKIPIFVLFDKDAQEQVNEIKQKLRKIDYIHLLNSGEFEDLLPLSLIVRTINAHLENFASITINEIDKTEPMVKILENIYKERGFHEFKKSEFAHLLSLNINSIDDVSDEIKIVINEIKNVANSYKSLI